MGDGHGLGLPGDKLGGYEGVLGGPSRGEDAVIFAPSADDDVARGVGDLGGVVDGFDDAAYVGGGDVGEFWAAEASGAASVCSPVG